jgi:pantoate--beta-alanine ligase
LSKTPIIINTPEEMRAHTSAVRGKGGRVGFVPTMGALHEGHLALVDYARERCDEMVVSIFVNPLQFDREDDLSGYPRTWQADLDLCTAHGVDVIYYPNAEAMYPDGFQTKVCVAEMTQGLCGAHRSGHFDGVTTVVLKLFNAVQSDLAVFGEKDYQQLAVIKRMTRDLDLGVEVVGHPTVREADGLSLSSRNVHLSPQERKNALCLWRGLNKAMEMAANGEKNAAKLRAAALAEIEAVPEARMEYLEVVDAESLEPLEEINRPARMAMAVWMGETRLIDNAPLD